MSLSLVFSGVRVVQSLVFYVVLWWPLFVVCPLHCLSFDLWLLIITLLSFNFHVILFLYIFRILILTYDLFKAICLFAKQEINLFMSKIRHRSYQALTKPNHSTPLISGFCGDSFFRLSADNCQILQDLSRQMWFYHFTNRN